MSFFHAEDEVTICSFHQERPTQLIWTSAFPYKEFWCPACGATWGMFGAGKDAKWSWTIHNRYVADKKRSERFLNARGILICASKKYKGKWVKRNELPESYINYCKNVVKNWKYIK